MQFVPLLFLLLIGLFIGISGIGGFLIPPVLLKVFDITIREAIIIALGAQVIIYLGGCFPYLKIKKVDFKISTLLVLGSIPGSLLGLLANINFSDEMLKISLAVFLVIIVFTLLGEESHYINCCRERFRSLKIFNNNAGLLKQFFLLMTGFLGGLMSGLIGVGGPVISVPLMISLGYNSKLAIGTSIFSGIFIVAFAFSFHVFFTSINFYLTLLIGIFTGAASLTGGRLAGVFKERTSRLIVIFATIFSVVYLILFA